MGFTIKFTLDGVTFTREDIRDISEVWETLSLSYRITEALKHGPLTVKDIAEEVAESENKIRAYLSRLTKRGKVVKVGDKWGLIAEGLL
jgi:predicted transcriptional regulator of viral defense system